jgi:hypothetical protein
MKSIVQAVAITAGGVAMAAALTVGFAYGMLLGIINDDPEVEE